MESHSAIARFASPIGMIELSANDRHLLGLRILTQAAAVIGADDHPLLLAAAGQIHEWFARTRRTFDLPLKPLTTPRGEALRAGIIAVPYGETRTYGALATDIGSAPRAIGQACQRNPFPLIVPCHRVTSSSGPEHYSGGDGARTKAWLIGFEAGERVDYGQGCLF
ncbi:MAG: methylated-DNA--[protein]-cysteine S-methyltransferase [Sphingomonadaceae bacterium]